MSNMSNDPPVPALRGDARGSGVIWQASDPLRPPAAAATASATGGDLPGWRDKATLTLVLAAFAARERRGAVISSPDRLPQAILGPAATDGGSGHVTRPPSFAPPPADPSAEWLA